MDIQWLVKAVGLLDVDMKKLNMTHSKDEETQRVIELLERYNGRPHRFGMLAKFVKAFQIPYGVNWLKAVNKSLEYYGFRIEEKWGPVEDRYTLIKI